MLLFQDLLWYSVQHVILWLWHMTCNQYLTVCNSHMWCHANLFLKKINNLLLSGIKYAQKKKLFTGKNTEDIGRVWDHFPAHTDIIPGWPWLQWVCCVSTCYNSYNLDESHDRRRIIWKVKLPSMVT